MILMHLDATSLCQYLSHSMHPRCKVSNFLNLRIVCWAAVETISSQIRYRVAALLHHDSEAVREAAQKIKHSGILDQLLMPGRRLRRLTMGHLGIPKGMSQEYWDSRQKLKLITRWTDKGKLEL